MLSKIMSTHSLNYIRLKWNRSVWCESCKHDINIDVNKTKGELLCGQHQQQQKCVLASKLQCT